MYLHCFGLLIVCFGRLSCFDLGTNLKYVNRKFVMRLTSDLTFADCDYFSQVGVDIGHKIQLQTVLIRSNTVELKKVRRCVAYDLFKVVHI
jgi:hypothetical protein